MQFFVEVEEVKSSLNYKKAPKHTITLKGVGVPAAITIQGLGDEHAAALKVGAKLVLTFGGGESAVADLAKALAEKQAKQETERASQGTVNELRRLVGLPPLPVVGGEK